jgi:hypothetical protein
LVNYIIINIQNVYSLGGQDESNDPTDDLGDPRSEVLLLDGEDWREVGKLQIVRAEHAATMIDTASFMEFCN